MKVKFSRCLSSNLANVPSVDGQLIYTKDTGEAYIDVGNVRNKLSDVVNVADVTQVVSPIASKLYYDEATEKLYKYVNNNWKDLSGGQAQDPQVFYWNGVTSPADVSYWNNILEVLKTSPVVVFRYVTKSNRKYVLSWYFHNTLPTAWTEDSSYAEVTSIGGSTSSGHMVGYKCTQYLYFTITDGVVTGMANTNAQEITINYLDTEVDMGGNYIPQYNSSPANKKYVDTQVGNINTILDSINGEVV